MLLLTPNNRLIYEYVKKVLAFIVSVDPGLNVGIGRFSRLKHQHQRGKYIIAEKKKPHPGVFFSLTVDNLNVFLLYVCQEFSRAAKFSVSFDGIILPNPQTYKPRGVVIPIESMI